MCSPSHHHHSDFDTTKLVAIFVGCKKSYIFKVSNFLNYVWRHEYDAQQRAMTMHVVSLPVG